MVSSIVFQGIKNNIKANHTFESLTLIKPLWYFHLQGGDRLSWPDPNNVDSSIVLDDNYDSHTSAELEASFLLLIKGWIPKRNIEQKLFLNNSNRKPSIKDEFRFIRKHFHPGWCIVYFLYCIATLKNPIWVFCAFFKTIGVKRQPLFTGSIGKTMIPETDGLHLIHQKVSIRIIIPTYNRYDALVDVLKDLEQQDYTCFSVTVVDQSTPYNEKFYDNYNLDIQLIRQENSGLWRARNRAIQESKEEIIALLDDDSRLNPNWLRKHLQCLDYFDAKISAGVSISTRGAQVPENYSFYRLSDQLDTGNTVLYRSVFETCGLFDEQFEGMRMGDGEFGIRVYKLGILNISNPEAKRIHLKVKKGGLRELGSWDSLRPTNLFNPRPIPSVLYLASLHFEKLTILRYLFVSIPFSLSPYYWKSTKLGMILSLFLFFLLFPLVIMQIIRSWIIAISLIREGPKIQPMKTL